MKRTTALLCLGLPLAVYAQDKPKFSPSFSIGSGIVSGQTDNTIRFDLTAGVRSRMFFLGVGAAYDPYAYKTAPVYLEGRLDLDKKRLFFVYADAGYQLPLSSHKDVESNKISDKIKSGLYVGGGAGYHVPMGTRSRLAVSLGYSYKAVSEEKQFAYPCGITPCISPEPEVYTYDYNFGRITVKVAWEFGK